MDRETSSTITIERMDNLTEDAFVDEHRMNYYSLVKQLNNRVHVIVWINKLTELKNMSLEARDTCIQIFDRYLTLASKSRPAILADTKRLQLIAACCVILGSKMHDWSALSTSNFPQFSYEELIEWERIILFEIDFCVIPSVTPAAYIVILLRKWRGGDHEVEITELANRMVSDFVSDPEYLLFAPSTVAAAAVALACKYRAVNTPDSLDDLLTDTSFKPSDSEDMKACTKFFIANILKKKGIAQNCFAVSPPRGVGVSKQPAAASPETSEIVSGGSVWPSKSSPAGITEVNPHSF